MMTYMDLICRIMRGIQDGEYVLSDTVSPSILDDSREELLDYVRRMIQDKE